MFSPEKHASKASPGHREVPHRQHTRAIAAAAACVAHTSKCHGSHGACPHPPPCPPPTFFPQGFIRPSSRGIILSATSPGELIDKLAAYQAPPSLISLASQGLLDVHERG